MSQKITVLAPVNELPSEGAEADLFPEGREPQASDFLDSYASVFAETPLTFRVDAAGAVSLEGEKPVEDFVFLDVNADENGEPAFTLGDEEKKAELDLEGAAAAVTGTYDADDGVRRLVENLSARLRGVVTEGQGTPVPLVRWHKDEDAPEDEEGGVVQLLGVWLANEEQLSVLGEEGSKRIIFDESDVEGRGLKEAVAALAVMGVMLTGGASDADAGFLFFKSKAEKAAERKAQMEQQVHRGQARPVIVPHAVAKGRAVGAEVIVDVSKQRAYLVASDGEILINTPVSTARTGKYTPRGEFKITQRVRTGKKSTIYGCDLPYWMRLNQSAIGLHVGDLPGYPASAGCIRLPSNVAPVLFDATKSGTTVKVVNSWQPHAQLYAGR